VISKESVIEDCFLAAEKLIIFYLMLLNIITLPAHFICMPFNMTIGILIIILYIADIMNVTNYFALILVLSMLLIPFGHFVESHFSEILVNRIFETLL